MKEAPPMQESNIQKQIQIDIIKETKRLIAGKTEQQRFQIARQHLFNALDYKTPRIDIMEKECSPVLRLAYEIQTFFLWRSFLLLISYLFMYTSFFGHVHPSPAQIGVEFAFLFFMILDVFLEVYHKKFNKLRPHSGFQGRFYFRVSTLILLLADEIIVCSTQSLPVRPFLIFRCVLPVIYDPQMRKMFYALFAAYIDILVYLIFYTLIIIMFAIMANQFVQFPPDQKFDNYTGNYPQLGKSIFLMYVLTTFDAYPDNQLVAIRINIWIYAFFIIFIFLNALFFVTIPTNILLSSIKDTRSKTIIIDEIEQQHNLIMAFITLGGDTIKKIPYAKAVHFLMFVFNNQPRYVDKITEICHNLDEKVDGTIEVTQFMQLCKIMQSKTYLRPPRYNFWKPLKPFQNFVHETLGLKDLIKSKNFEIVIAIFVFLSFINCILTIYVENNVFDIIDDVIMLIIVIEVVFKLVGLGPQLYFNNILNIIDIIVVVIGIFLETAPNDIIPRNSGVFIKMFRIFRITLLVRYIKSCWNISYRSEVYVKLTKLINQMGLIIPIVFKFFPLYMISFYFLGVIGVQVFWYETQISPADSPYSFYNQFSNFKTLLGAQFIFVQVLTEAGWSLVAYDHAYRYGTFALTMLFFVICHQIIVIILTSLLKGITWQVYHSIEEEQQSYYDRMEENERNYLNLKKRLDQIDEVKGKIQKNQNLKPDNLLVRQLYEKKIDKQIMAKFIELQIKRSGALFFHKKSKTNLIQSSQKNEENYPLSNSALFGSASNMGNSSDLKIKRQQGSPMIRAQSLNSNKELNKSGLIESNQIMINISQSKLVEPSSPTNADSSIQIEQLKQQDIQKEIDQLLNEIVLHSGIKFSLKIDYPAPFLDYLKQKLKLRQVRHLEGEFDIEKDVFQKSESMVLFTHGLHTLLGMQTSQREQRKLVLNEMVKRGILAPDKAKKMVTQKSEYEDEAKFDHNWIIRKTYLEGIDERVVNKFETQYFSAVYGQSFKQINKSRIYPLMRAQSRLTYCLSNLLRYREMSTYEFFNTLIHVENKISIKLLKPGSLFKFVYQINTNSQSWFSVELKDSNTLRVHFIKNGIWIYHRDLQEDQIYISNDIFNWEEIENRPDKNECASYIKRFYQSFESLAFCLNDYETFFQPQPENNVYDLYSYYTNVEDTKRYIKKQLSISKIMVVLLSKEQERKQPVSYKLSDLKFEDDQMKAFKQFKQKHFRLDKTEKQTFQLLKKFQNMPEEDIAQGEGLPYAYIVNFLEHLTQIVSLGKKNFVYHIQKLLNQHFKAQHDDMVNPNMKKKQSTMPKLQ